MAAVLKWRSSWSSSTLQYGEAWAESWLLETAEMAAVGTPAITGDVGWLITFDVGSGTMDMGGRSTIATPGFDYIIADTHHVSGSLAVGGRTTIEGALDFEEPFFVDPPLTITPAAHSGLTGTIEYFISKSIGSGTMVLPAHCGFVATTLTMNVGVIKPLFSVALPAVGRSTLIGNTVATTIKALGIGSMAVGGRSSVAQTGFSIEGPGAYTHPMGDGILGLIAAGNLSSDIGLSFVPPTPLGDLSLSLRGATTLSIARLFSGGPLPLPALSMSVAGRTTLQSAFSYPGADTYSETEAVAVYEGMDMQEAVADLEGDDIVV